MTDSPVPGFGLREGTARRRAGFVLLGVAGALLFGADLAFGSVGIPFAEAVKALFGAASDPAWNDIVRIFRLPKALTAASAGAALALAGLILQTIFRNPLAGPDSLGIGAGASVGVGVVVLLAGGSSGATLLTGLGLAGWAGLAAAAALGSLAVLLLILAAARRVENGVTLLIVGLLVGYLAGALVSLMVWFGSPQKTQVFLGWTYGSFSGVTLERLPVLLGAVGLGAALTGRSAKPLDALLLGERYAESVGIRVRPARARVLVEALERLPGQHHFPRTGHVEAGQQPDQRRLAGAGSADDGDRFTRVDGKTHVLEDRQLATCQRHALGQGAGLDRHHRCGIIHDLYPWGLGPTPARVPQDPSRFRAGVLLPAGAARRGRPGAPDPAGAGR